MTDIDIRGDFPLLAQSVNGQPLVYLDNAATTQKPRSVLDAMRHYYEFDNANVHRAAHALAARATDAMESARAAVATFIGAPAPEQVIFTRGTTESVNLVASSLAQGLVPGDEILVTAMEHHSNFVPWFEACRRSGAVLQTAGVTATGEIDLRDFTARLSPRTRVVAFAHVSNALGTLNPVEEMLALVRRQAPAAKVLIDGAQAALHVPLDVRALDADFYAFSAHKMFGPTGMGVLYGRRDALEALPPYQFGGEMIEAVSLEAVTYNRLPYRFEAGTPNIAGAIGLGAAVDYLNTIPRDTLVRREASLVSDAMRALADMPGVRLVGTPKQRVGVVSFLVEGGHAHDVGTLLDQQGVAVRTGHHCTMPLMHALGVNGTVRASFSLYNDASDLERLLRAMHKTLTFL